MLESTAIVGTTGDTGEVLMVELLEFEGFLHQSVIFKRINRQEQVHQNRILVISFMMLPDKNNG